ncbi:SEC-C metal-binding domain-containing protein [Polyangium sp. y55x31]|uniref:YecA family protein n=1 Tax=Polyangium sp. y55x31 TaxID=3042688 RepID=UPI002482ADB6|nr:SEC-C metal-binding domain-containing protein [Polyangium sp. y55x31]MDI1483519.1 SEC-C metal-binding domain-containing protein [Polyangium sp. y55x31]
MGHAHHFLSRLDRVSLPHVELALSLYRDESLLRYIFDRARVPENAERVALSLDHPEEGPFLIVTRGGRFVTCLGEGMKVSNLPVVTRGQIDGFSAKAEELRERLESAKALAGGKGVRSLLRRIYEAADELSREEFVAISALQPLYAFEFLRLYLHAASELDDARKTTLLPLLRKTDKPRPVYDDALYAYWRTLWAMGHFAVLATLDGRETFPPGFLELLGETTTFSWPATRQGFLPFALRGAWATARIGKPLLGLYKRFYQDAESELQNIDSALGILAIGMRHARLRAEAEKALGADIPEKWRDTEHGKVTRAIRKIARTIAEMERDAPEDRQACVRDFGAHLWVGIMKSRPAGPLRYERAEDVPEDLACAVAANTFQCYLRGSAGLANALTWLYTLIPWAARAAPEALYLPRAAVAAVHEPFRPELALGVLRAMRDHVAPARRQAPPEGPARKGPCPCGSGKKYKRCCEEKETEEKTEAEVD